MCGRSSTQYIYLSLCTNCNTDSYLRTGTHWCAFYFQKKGVGEFFDSYGRKPSFYNNNFHSFLKTHANESAIINTNRLQSDYSNVSGFYCLLYLVGRFNSISMNSFVKMFTPNHYSLNDFFIYQYILKVFPNCVSNQCVLNQTCTPIISADIIM